MDKVIEAHVKAMPFFELLSTIPGVGATLGAIIVAEAGDIRRFDDPDQFAAYAGLVPATWESGGSRTSGGRFVDVWVMSSRRLAARNSIACTERLL